mgnify:CR=1 FL=1
MAAQLGIGHHRQGKVARAGPEHNPKTAGATRGPAMEDGCTGSLYGAPRCDRLKGVEFRPPLSPRSYATVGHGLPPDPERRLPTRGGVLEDVVEHEEAVGPLFDTLDWLEKRLSRQRYVAGDRFTEADIRLFTTLVRFDPVYHGHFKCNVRRIVDYPNLWKLTREIYQMPEVRETVHFDHIKRHYYMSHRSVNPKGIVPVGPEIDFDEPVDG